MSIIGLSMAALPCCAEEDVEAGSAALRVDWPVYPRRAEHNTVAEGGNRGWAETARQNAFQAAFAEFERELIRERTRAGMRASKRRGHHVGRPRKLTPHKIDHARQLIAEGKETKAGAAALLGVDAVTLRRALNGGIGPIILEAKQTGERSAGNPHAAFDEAGAGNVARPRWCDTRRRKSEPTGNTNFGLTRRASPRPYR